MVALSSDLPHPRSVLGYSLAIQWRFAEAEQEYRKTLELEPEHPYAVPNLGHVLFASGKPAEAVPVYRKMVEMGKRGLTTGDPAKDNFDLALALRESGNPREARAIAEQASAAVLKKLKGARPGPFELAALGSLAAAAGQTDRASRYLEQAERFQKVDADTLMDIAELQALLGRKQDALATIRKSRSSGYSDFFFPVIIPGFQSMRNDSEFKALFSPALYLASSPREPSVCGRWRPQQTPGPARERYL